MANGSRRLLALVGLVALLTTACLKVNVAIEVADDGSGRISGVVAVDASAAEDLFGGLGEDVAELGGELTRGAICDEFVADTSLDPGISSQPYDDGRFCGVEFDEDFSAGDAGGDLDGLTGQGAVVRREGTGWYAEIPLDLSEIDAGQFDIPIGPNPLEDSEYVVRLKLPGRQVEHNGDFIDDDGFVVWDIDVLDPPTEPLMLRTQQGEPITGQGGDGAGGDDDGGGADDGGGNTGLVIGLLALVALAVVAIVVLVVRNRGSATAEPSAEAAIVSPGGPAGMAGGVAGAATAPPTAPPTTPTAGATQVVPPPDPGPRSPTPHEATGSPVWDPTRGRYVQWDPVANGWLSYDDATQTWQRDP